MTDKKKSGIIFWMGLSSLFAFVAACANPQPVEERTDAPTRTPSIEATQTVIPLPTETLVPTSTPTRTATPTPEPVWVMVLQNAFCRTGPGTTFAISDYLPAGYEVELAGKTEVPRVDETLAPEVWYVVPRPSDGEVCWIFNTLVEVTGNLDGVAMMSPPPTYTPEPSGGPAPVKNALLYFLILKDTGGPVGCGDSLIAVNSGVARARTLEENIINVLNALFSLKTEYSDGLYNAMYKSDLRAKRVELDGRIAYVYTKGTVVKPKEDCDKERFRVQVWATVENFSDVDRAIIYANNALLGDLLEQGGKK